MSINFSEVFIYYIFLPMAKYPFYKQTDVTDCGITCLRMICEYYGKFYSTRYLSEMTQLTKNEISLWALNRTALSLGFKTLSLKMTFENLTLVRLPCIVHWESKHFVVVYKAGKEKVLVADPAHKLKIYSSQIFESGWRNYKNGGIVMLLEPTHKFYKNNIKF